MNVLTGLHIPLKHGWIGVVNRFVPGFLFCFHSYKFWPIKLYRSQRDIMNRKPITEALQDEREFFARHAQYHILGPKVGTTFLGHRCNEVRSNDTPILSARITKYTLNSSWRTTSARLCLVCAIKCAIWLQPKKLNSPHSVRTRKRTSPTHPLPRAGCCCKSSIDSRRSSKRPSKACLTRSRLRSCKQIVLLFSIWHVFWSNGGARIRYIFHESFVQNLNKISATTNLTLSDIRTALRNAAGPKASLFVPDAAFELLAKRQIEMLRDPAHQCAEVIHSELMRIVQQLEAKDLQRYPKLRLKILETANHMMKKLVKQSNALVEQLIALELTYINTSHPDFVGLGLLKPRQGKARVFILNVNFYLCASQIRFSAN